MSLSASIDSLVSKSLVVSLMRRRRKIIGPYTTMKNTRSGKQITPTRQKDMDAISKNCVSITIHKHEQIYWRELVVGCLQ